MNHISLSGIESYALDGKILVLEEDVLKRVRRSFEFLESFSENTIIYGINTGFGPMAQYRIEAEDLKYLQYNLIRSHSSGIGKTLDETYARGVVLARLASLSQGNSGISEAVLQKLQEFLNYRIVPEVFEHGGVGASGDLVQLSHLALNLIGEGFVYDNGNRVPAAEALQKHGLGPLQLSLRDGLGLINGTSCMTGIAAVNLIYAKRLLDWGIAASSILNEIVCSFDDSFSEELNAVKKHAGQQKVAAAMRSFLSGSDLLRKRDDLYRDANELKRKEFKKKIQEYYSVRCVPQILGPVFDTIQAAIQVVENEFNSTNDNPIVDMESGNVFHGGNFHGDYISLEMDKLKLVLTKLTMLMERQLNFLLNNKLNGKFPPFLNAGTLGLNFGFQGMQFTATSTTAENQTLSNSMYVHSIPNNNDNQDIVSMGTNSALIARTVLENGFQVMAIHLMAVCQAIDLLDGEEREVLSPNTVRIYNSIRERAPFVKDDVVPFPIIREVYELIRAGKPGAI
ncbi:aromatic amino acid ammonia-lyase [Ravibacter arvi]|uniref:Aromatic amino acid ammonia-lyase n=1 Tax=Ravibacter arvi TaxID=2051041 RepID=A0ABP8M8U7_9BACT